MASDTSTSGSNARALAIFSASRSVSAAQFFRKVSPFFSKEQKSQISCSLPEYVSLEQKDYLVVSQNTFAN
jgi:hypothetical protein